MKVSAAVLLAVAFVSSAAPAQPVDPDVEARISRILARTPLIDGHNDLAEELRENYAMKVEGLARDTELWKPKALMTDMARLRRGKLGAQFWSVYVPSELTGDNAIRDTLEQIDTVKRLVRAYPADLELAGSADDIERIHKNGRIASLIGIEGGHQIGGSLAALRQFYDLGARYMTLTHFKNNEFADSATDDPKYHGMTAFGRTVVHEMNRLGMLVDLSHVSPETMRDALQATRAPVLFTHSDARALADHPRNVPDDILKLVAANGGVVMVNFYLGHLSPDFIRWSSNKAAQNARSNALYPGQPVRREAAMNAWLSANPAPRGSVRLIADHVEHVARIAGYDHVGIGGDLDGIDTEEAPTRMNSVSAYPLLFAELIRRGWSDANLARLAGANVLRVMRKAESVAASMRSEPPAMARLRPWSATKPWE